MPRSFAFLMLILPGFLAAQDFPTATPDSQGISGDKLEAMTAWVAQEELEVRSLLVLRRGHLVMEWYAPGVDRQTPHNVYSVTKSVVATLAGIAIERDHLPGVDASLATLFPDLAPTSAKGKVTLENLLTMRSGLPQSRGNQPGKMRDLFNRIQRAPDRTKHILQDLEMTGVPGKKFTYGNIEPHLVLAAIEKHSGQQAMAFAKEHLFEPLGFQNASWKFADKTGQVPGGYGLHLRAIDLAKLGQLYLQEGRWEDRQVLSADWIRQSTQDHTGTGYGYYWWVDSANKGYSAKGVRGQRLEIYPKLELVFVMTAQLPGEQVPSVTKTLTTKYLLPAVQGP